MHVKARKSKWPGGWNEITEYKGEKKKLDFAHFSAGK